MSDHEPGAQVGAEGAGQLGVPPGAPEAEPGTQAYPRRAGLDVAREALAAAKAEAMRRGARRSRGAAPDAKGRSGTAATSEGTRGSRRTVDQRSGAHPDERDPQLLGSSFDRLLAERGWETDLAVGGVMGRWATIVGDDLAEHCLPVSFDRGELVVQAESTAWATQLRLLARQLVARLNDELGAGTVASVKVLAPRAPSWKRGRLSVRGRGTRDTYG